MGVAVLGVDEGGNSLHDVEKQFFDLGEQTGAVQRDARLIADRGE